MAKTTFNFNPKSGPSILITGGILFVLIGTAISGWLIVLGIAMIIAGIALSVHWSKIIKNKYQRR